MIVDVSVYSNSRLDPKYSIYTLNRTIRTYRYAVAVLATAFCLVSADAQVVPRGSSVRPPALSAQLHRAEIAYKSGASLLEAKVRVDRVLTELPNDAQALKLRAKVYVSMKRYTEALTDARRAAAVDPDDGEAQLLVSISAQRAGSTDLALRAMDRAAALLVDDASAHVELSGIAREMGLLDRAEAYARISVALDPTLASGQLELARAFVAQKKYPAAILILQKAIESGTVKRETILSDSLLRPIHDTVR